jgi:hypothetical protein
VNVTLTKPVPVVQRDTHVVETLPAGTVVEISDSPSSFFVNVGWNGRGYSMFREDLLEACTWEDVGRMGLLVGMVR